MANQDGPRLGLVVSRRVSTKAVVRNRIKRQVRESFRLHRVALGTFDIVVAAQAAAARASNAELSLSLQRHWKRLAE